MTAFITFRRAFLKIGIFVKVGDLLMNEDETNLIKKFPMAHIVLGIGDVAEATGVSQSQLRYWERKGYIHSQEVGDGKNRKFSYKTLIQVQQIKTLLDQGLTLVAAVKQAKRRKDLFDALRSFVDGRFSHVSMADDGDVQINLGQFDPDPTQELIAERVASQWHFKLIPAVK
ncbi:transcriptional regulator [Levilactobacillus parabrevis ATCC 53295]|uniref:Transcriptional regulator n=2 Tax=Levilactobacillus parabrevis TaxID=357278 RepID=A0A0R1GQ18_9LACO|nr:transcriptional regulator [Levilactobacillus parabrevis ATCC 53295]KRO05453.1 transcriptional regulator [Levilactobacillus parabrevis]